ncbi:MAG TPA: BTAD domain-containing putative transcriptional regulator [Streptosporangiaceae bacterium]|nr:BTAD domain-containing putative transcriptional regulator [Streptosporangiaceae bacterium]
MRFRILGPLEIWTGQDWSGIGAAKWRALLAALLLNPGQVVSTERLSSELWDNEPPDRAANLVSVYVLRLRRLMADPQGRLLVTRAPGYLLRLEPGDLDASSFETLASQGRLALASGDAPTAAALLAEALALWRGGALIDVPPSGLVTAEADRLEESRLAALELRILADIRCGSPAQLVPELRRLISDHPLREGLWALLMQALDRGGRRAEAVAAYSEARRVISDELGVDPGPELYQHYQRLLQADMQAASTAQAASTMQAASTAQAATPQHVHPSVDSVPAEPAAGDHARAAPAALAPDAEPARGQPGHAGIAGTGIPAQLPADIADFTGRKTHLERLRALLASGSNPGNPAAVNIAGVVGTPGLGKTVLAVHAAHEIRREFPDGQLFVSLLGGGQQPAKPDEVLARLLRDLGVEPGRIPVSLDERAALYRTRLTDRRVLIVLDDARDSAQLRPLLPGSASCAVIVTSRHWLTDLAGSRLVDLDALADDEAEQMLTRIIGADRAAAEPGPVREVLNACGGLPLAIRIAGARLAARRGWTVRTLASRLADQQRRLDELTTGDLAVRACFEVSFASLPHPASPGDLSAAQAFRLLGLWQGPHISLQAATALLGQPQDAVADALEVLVDTHLLESPAPEWYRFHDLLRVYAAERAKAEETREATRAAITRLLQWYLRTADAAVSVINPNRDRVPMDAVQLAQAALGFETADEALAWSARERANLVAATRQAAAEGLHDIAWKLPVALMLCFDLHGYRAEWLATHEVALASAQSVGDRSGEAWTLNNIGIVLSQQRAPDADTYFKRALAIRQDLGDLRGQAQAANNLAFSYQFQGLHESAVQPLRDALALQRKVGHRYGEAVALCNLGEAYLELGRHAEAIACEQDALAIVQEIDSPRLEGYVLQHLGRARLDGGGIEDGSALLEQALASHRAQGDKYGEAEDLQHLGGARAQARRAADARGLLERAAELFEGLGDDSHVASIRSALDGLDALVARP